MDVGSKRVFKPILFLLVILTAAVISSTYVGAIGFAHADSAGEDTPSRPDSCSVYYFSDYAGSEMLVNAVKEATDIDVCHKLYSWFNPFNEIREDVENGYFDDIKDSYVIFETRMRFKNESNSAKRAYDPDDSHAHTEIDTMQKVFQILRDNNCKIMYVCGTDELLYKRNNDLFDLVDIHVNTDKLFWLIAAAFNELYIEYNKTLNNCTLMFDRCYSLTESNSVDDEFVRDFLCGYVQYLYLDSVTKFYDKCESEDRDKPQHCKPLHEVEALNKYNVKVLQHISDDVYYDIFDGSSVSSIDLCMSDDPSSKKFVAIGADIQGEQYSDEWIDAAKNLLYAGKSVDVFAYDTSGYIRNEYRVSSLIKLFCYGIINDLDLIPIITDFITDYDLMKYDNWSGRCIVTHKLSVNYANGVGLELLDEWSLNEVQIC